MRKVRSVAPERHGGSRHGVLASLRVSPDRGGLTSNQMVGSRRELLDRLYAHNGQTLNELCARLAESGTSMTRQAVSKHLAILEGANLVATVKRGREKLHYLNPVPIHEIAARWIGKYERHRLSALAELKRGLEAKK